MSQDHHVTASHGNSALKHTLYAHVDTNWLYDRLIASAKQQKMIKI